MLTPLTENDQSRRGNTSGEERVASRGLSASAEFLVLQRLQERRGIEDRCRETDGDSLLRCVANDKTITLAGPD